MKMIDKILEIDRTFFLFLNNLGTSSWDPFWIIISNKICMFFVLSSIILFSLFKHKQQAKYIIYTMIFMILCICLTDLVHVHMFKNTFMRLRPCWDPEISSLTRIIEGKGGYYGFVSGHSANSAALVSFFLLSYRNTHWLVKYTLITWVFLVSYSRIYLGKHYTLDVLFGMLLGFLIGFIVFKLYHFYIKQKQ